MDVLEFADAAGWESWLEARHGAQTEAWLRIGKRNSGVALITITDALDVALCYGWIDGHRKSLDDVSFLQRYSRRRPRSSWSKVNVAKVEALTAAGRMRPPGLAEVEAAKTDGRWDAAYESQAKATVPPDLAAALAGDAGANAAFESLGRSERYAVILPLLKARSPEAREKVLAREIERLANLGPGDASTETGLPGNIGAPATRALIAAGYTGLMQLAGVPASTLLQLHGVGPKALARLQEALEARGRSLG